MEVWITGMSATWSSTAVHMPGLRPDQSESLIHFPIDMGECVKQSITGGSRGTCFLGGTAAHADDVPLVGPSNEIVGDRHEAYACKPNGPLMWEPAGSP